jgi:hypothetical protein
MTDRNFYALDQNGNKIFKGDTVFRRAKNKLYADISYPPDRTFYVVSDVQPDYVFKQGHRYERKDMPEGGPCAYISVDGPDGDYPKNGRWYADDFIFSCRGE